jgi:hypothetical protein
MMCEQPAAASTTTRPRWSLLYGAGFSAVAALAVLELVTSPGGLRTGLRCAIALAAFFTLAAWVRANRAALDLQGWCDCAPGMIAIHVIESSKRTARVASVPPYLTRTSIENEHDVEHEVAHR